METGIQSSFIPQDAGKAPLRPRYERSGGLGDLLLILSIVLLVTSGALAGAVFMYKQYLETNDASVKQQLQAAQQSLDPTFIQQITRLDDRMQAANTILGAHIAPSAVFLALQQITLQNVSFTSIDLKADDPQHITAKLSGVAASVNSIALEADVISKTAIIKSPIFSGITRQQDGVHFDLDASIDQRAINYVSLIDGALRNAGVIPSAGSAVSAPTQVPASTTPAAITTMPGTSTKPSMGPVMQQPQTSPASQTSQQPPASAGTSTPLSPQGSQ